MTHLLDTNICSAHMRRPGGLAHYFFQYAGRIAIPSVVLAELYAGAYKHPNSFRLLGLIADLLQEVAVLDFDSACAEQFGKTQGELWQNGIAVSVPDLMIASVALVYDLTLVTHNTADFRNIPGLRLADALTSCPVASLTLDPRREPTAADSGCGMGVNSSGMGSTLDN